MDRSERRFLLVILPSLVLAAVALAGVVTSLIYATNGWAVLPVFLVGFALIAWGFVAGLRWVDRA